MNDESRFSEDREAKIDEELSAAIEEAVASSERGESIPWEVFRKELFDEQLTRATELSERPR